MPPGGKGVLCAGGRGGWGRVAGVAGAGSTKAWRAASPPWMGGGPVPRVAAVRTTVQALGLGIGGISLVSVPSHSQERAGASVGSQGSQQESPELPGRTGSWSLLSPASKARSAPFALSVRKEHSSAGSDRNLSQLRLHRNLDPLIWGLPY